MKKILLCVVLMIVCMAGLAGCGTNEPSIDSDVVVSYDYKRFDILGNTEGDNTKWTKYSSSQVVKVEFRGNYNLVTIYYKNNINDEHTYVITTSANNVKLYYTSDNS